MKKRTGDPWMSAPAYAHQLEGLTLNLLVRDVSGSVAFQRAVFGSEVVYEDPDFAVIRLAGAEWQLHADHTYDHHETASLLAASGRRGTGAEFRLHHTDPDEAEAAARAHGYTIVAPATTKPHGLREAYILDPDGYWWVPDVPV